MVCLPARRAAAVVVVLALAATPRAETLLPRSPESCVNKFVDAIDSQRGEEKNLFRACFDAQDLLVRGQITHEFLGGPPDRCGDLCLAYAVRNVTADAPPGPQDNVKAVYMGVMGKCFCVKHYPKLEDPDCEETEGIYIWDIPLNCAAADRDPCFDMKNCERHYGCCYAKGTVQKNPFWEISQMTAQLVFFVVALAFATQLLVYSTYRVARWCRGSSDDATPGDTDLRATFLPSITPEHYASFLESLPSVTLATDTLRSGTCTVCLEDYVAGSRCIELPDCGHIFHLDCIRDFAVHEVRQHRPALCPNCRAKIYTPEQERPADPPKTSEASAAEAADSVASPRATPRQGSVGIELQDISADRDNSLSL